MLSDILFFPMSSPCCGSASWFWFCLSGFALCFCLLPSLSLLQLSPPRIKRDAHSGSHTCLAHSLPKGLPPLHLVARHPQGPGTWFLRSKQENFGNKEGTAEVGGLTCCVFTKFVRHSLLDWLSGPGGGSDYGVFPQEHESTGERIRCFI